MTNGRIEKGKENDDGGWRGVDAGEDGPGAGNAGAAREGPGSGEPRARPEPDSGSSSSSDTLPLAHDSCATPHAAVTYEWHERLRHAHLVLPSFLSYTQTRDCRARGVIPAYSFLPRSAPTYIPYEYPRWLGSRHDRLRRGACALGPRPTPDE
ncbi:hypothetical protein EVAR_30786_1 [Eumeta japonica]|uniref:Uncharacterized protein n=1 Tax=Eumeta variegata TaxID=151549 RepID=A0A4C1V7F8_EUMVA|nr:hypothetical protein EVAR_30786_1 [Eumeta japonica]